MLDLFDGKVFARLARYESSMVGLTAFGNRGNVENPNNRNLDVLLDNGLIDQAERDARDVITNSRTFGRESDRIQNYINNVTAFEGLGDQGSRGRSFNRFTNYRFSEGPLSGFNIGGGIRYLGPMTVTADVANQTVIWGNDKTLVDLLMGYRFKTSNNVDIKFQLNVKNLLDETDFTEASRDLNGRLERMALQTPREYQFRTTVSF